MELIEYGGWQDCIRLANEHVELIATTAVGPRVISYRRLTGANVFKTYPEQLGLAGEADWQIRGGHRLWVAPERTATYFADNHPVDYNKNKDGSVTLMAPVETDHGYQKSLTLALSEDSSEVTVEHELASVVNQTDPIALWSLSVMKPGGIARVPLPQHRPHPSDTQNDKFDAAALLPNQRIALWPYASLADPRFAMKADEAQIWQQESTASFKIGFEHKEDKVFYDCDDERFSKSVTWQASANYPDNGCNLEIYTNGEMLELEALGPLAMLQANDKLMMRETWTLESI